MKKIFPKEWKETHPYKNSDPSDVYYTKIANTVLTILDIVEFDKMLENNMTRRVALALTSWFPDFDTFKNAKTQIIDL